MNKNEKILEAIYAALDEVNKMLPTSERIKKSENILLIGHNAELDSLQLMNLIVELEQQIEIIFNSSIILTDEKAMNHSPNPFTSISTLVEYISLLMEK
jgi:acyl carrier protein